jgi:hypothetical protein
MFCISCNHLVLLASGTTADTYCLHLQVAKTLDFGLAAMLLVATVTYLQPPSLSDS